MALTQHELAIVMATKKGLRSVKSKLRKALKASETEALTRAMDELDAVDQMITRLIEENPESKQTAIR